MNVKFAILSTIAIIAASSTVQSAEARDGAPPSQRFDYAPNVWRNETARMPAGYGQPVANPHSVGHGSMPSGRNMLGFDPKMLAARPRTIGPRVAPIVQQNVNSTVGFTNVVPMFNPFAPVANKGQFGTPIGNPPVMAALPPQTNRPQGQAVQQKSIAPPSTNNSLQGKINPRRSNTAVAARLQPRNRGLAAKSGSPIQTYGNNFGYSSGPTTPVGSGASTSVTGNVYGRVIYKSTKH